ncbi:MAG: zf-HC2 domain-containing protein [Burkholderiaceae bacterium]|jgi:predicted anti-sigma-YlaC factor YlaD|nr:zf-HC2 domain-containing protein [Burkholderiaceae bacterium]
MTLMPACDEVSRLLSRALDEPLGLVDRTLLQVHLRMCSSCRNVEQQLVQLRDLSHDLFDSEDAARGEPGGRD